MYIYLYICTQPVTSSTPSNTVTCLRHVPGPKSAPCAGGCRYAAAAGKSQPAHGGAPPLRRGGLTLGSRDTWLQTWLNNLAIARGQDKWYWQMSDHSIAFMNGFDYRHQHTKYKIYHWDILSDIIKAQDLKKVTDFFARPFPIPRPWPPV